VVSHDFDMDKWVPDERATIAVPDKPYGPPSSEIYFWIVPANAAGEWRWRLGGAGAPVDFEVTLDQTFQMLSGRAVAAGAPARVEGGRLRGDVLRLALTASVGARETRHEFEGRVAADTITGKVRTGDTEAAWNATRVKRGSIGLPE